MGVLKPLLMLLCVLVFVLSGCSWVLMESPPAQKDWETLEYANASCTESAFAPVVDSLFAVSSLALLGAAGSATDATVAGVLSVVFWGSSAATGCTWSSTCDEFKDVRAEVRKQEQRRLKKLQQEWDLLREVQTLNPPTPEPEPTPPAVEVPTPPTPPVGPVAPESDVPACKQDRDCLGERLCVEGECVWPQEVDVWRPWMVP